MYSVKIGLDAQSHDDFIENSKLPNLLQSSNWAKVKDNWGSELIGFFQDDKLKASCLVLIRPLPMGMSMLYIPRGIAMDYEDEGLLKFVIAELKKFAKSKKALFTKLDPAINFGAARPLISALEHLGLEYTGRTQDMHDTIQPRFNAVIHEEDFSEEALDKKTRQFLRKANNSHPIVVHGSKELVPVFAELMKKTESRKQVSLRNADYYEKLLDIYGAKAFISLIQFDMGAVKADLEQNAENVRSNLAKAKNEKRTRALNEELAIIEKNLSETQALIEQRGEVIPVAACLTINVFAAAETLYAGTDTDFQKYYPSYLAWYETIKHAFEQGAMTLNMGGLENSLSPEDGLLRFKKHFNPRIEEYVGEFDLPTHRLRYKLANYFYKRKKRK
ncbi:peptidoglycan bridge formation glycyltransferase FemA/FemB family protein [Lactococcus termiticola]|uniref:UDP-N-acetylmuramoylpentapeptide-lysine N(6)-alanyltransferase n=1 Tax=Lactococcus termiticola TaxID=2169526 RepID=A0A2R5HDW2_9LACT|nr:peptidoglycan bridge formation glycyltransferase FemA/FemB family protein [Lactococcus termiticola]GBG96212.1 UDP-N-acetylmuramoylpentapeptide-lysine N(6)-alanyltransferase [Lactococcus termiticola]